MLVLAENLVPVPIELASWLGLQRSQAQGWHYLTFDPPLYDAWDVLGYRTFDGSSPLFIELRLLHIDLEWLPSPASLSTTSGSHPSSFQAEQEADGYLRLNPPRLALLTGFLERLLADGSTAQGEADLTSFSPLGRDELRFWHLHASLLAYEPEIPASAGPLTARPYWYRYDPEPGVRSRESLPEGQRLVAIPWWSPSDATGDLDHLVFTRVYPEDLGKPTFELEDSSQGRGTLGFSQAGLRALLELLHARLERLGLASRPPAFSPLSEPATASFSGDGRELASPRLLGSADLTAALRSGRLTPDDLLPIRVFRKVPEMDAWGPLSRGGLRGDPAYLDNGAWYTLDNRLLAALKQAGITDTPVLAADPSELGAAGLRRVFRTLKCERWKFGRPQ
ncbi:hypothetical protein [Thermogemmatispora sp.]|uniref:hypothetical protein n=1 Tax=Thermogemmatispora sp. TaxID=1968838 RepID=UPI0035E45484